MSRAPALSVIVVNHNASDRLAACLDSVWNQQRIDLEVIVADAASTDHSRAWLETQRPRLAALACEDSPSTVAAANRGLAAARGEWVLLLRPHDRVVGDLILSDCLNWMRKTEAGVVAGEVACNDGRILKLRSHPNARAHDFTPEGATFYRRGLFEENGAFDPTLTAMAAYDLNLRLWKNRIRFKPVPLRVVASDRPRRFTWPDCREEILVRRRYFSRRRSAWSDLGSVLRCVFRR